MRPLVTASFSLLLAALASGCGGSPTAPQKDEVFYLHGGGVIDKNKSWETYFKQLDRPQNERTPRYVGVGIFEGDVRMARPIDWYIRAADYTPGKRFISYQSARQFLFSIFERLDHPEDSWDDVLTRYEADAREQGSQILSARVPIATANTQGRSYILRTKVKGRPAYQALSHEVIIRSDKRILLVQMVHRADVDTVSEEMAIALRSMVVY